MAAVSLQAQSTRKIRELQAKREQLEQQIAEQEGVLRSTKKDVKSQMDNLALLTGQIEERRKYIQSIEPPPSRTNSTPCNAT
jgi:septal ring factor EnvC (AmiA/AmiB activator)